MTADLSALIARLEAAEVGSRELDWRIAETFDIPDPWKRVEGIWPPFTERSKYDRSIPAFTTSLDAALALADRVLPCWVWEIRIDESGASVQGAPVWWLEGLAAPDEGGVSCDAATPALALVIAILRAKQGEGE